MIRYWFVILILSIASLPVLSAENDTIQVVRPVSSSYMFEVGSASVLDTYLSPLRYSGVDMQFRYERLQAMRFNPENWIMQMNTGVEYSPTHNVAGNHTIHTLLGDFKWGMMKKINAPNGVKLFVGGSTQFKGGVLYAPHNSNNVVSVKSHLSLNLTGMASYNMKIGRLPITLRYQATLPFVGAFVAMDYGESYYEIYVGNRKGLVNFGWWGNRFDMDNLVTADMHFGNTTLRVGYHGTICSSWIKNLNTQIYTNNFVIGVGGEWISLNPSKGLNADTKIISAMY